MMQPNELRIGTTVYYNGTHKEVGTVTGVTKYFDGSCLVNLNGRANGLYKIEELEPIELTEEILLKCGFKDEDTHLQLNLRNNWCYEWFDNLLGFSLCKGRRGLCLGKIKYVHELQNLHHSLTGEELEVNM